MLRDKSLVPLSHQHQHALALCVRIDRAMQAGDGDPKSWQAELGREFDHEIARHFLLEEQRVFPIAARFAELQDLVQHLVTDHDALRTLFARAKALDLTAAEVESLVEKLAVHIRKEERELFEGMQHVMSPEELTHLGVAMARSVSSNSCSLHKE